MTKKNLGKVSIIVVVLAFVFQLVGGLGVLSLIPQHYLPYLACFLFGSTLETANEVFISKKLDDTDKD